MMTSYLATSLNLIGIPFHSAYRIRNKYEFRNYCSELNITCPKYFQIKSHQRINYLSALPKDENQKVIASTYEKIVTNTEVVEFVKFPVIIKNIDGSGKGDFK
jgi:carbamoylphosphate synthase large subunit